MEPEAEWIAAPLADLPYPHRLFSSACAWKHAWNQEFERLGAPEDQTGLRQVFEQFVAAVGKDELARCKYHQGDWLRIAELACALISAGRYPNDEALYSAAATLAPDDAEWLVWLFDHPIHLDGDRLGNGQHRLCAMRCAGVERCPVEL